MKVYLVFKGEKCEGEIIETVELFRLKSKAVKRLAEMEKECDSSQYADMTVKELN